MKKKNLLLTFLLAALILGGGAKAWCYDFAQTEEHGQTLYYTITSNVEPYTVKVTYPNADAQYSGQAYGNYSISIDKPTGDITIPNSVVYNLTEYIVTAVDKWTFCACTEITSVSIPNSVESIGTYAFSGCTGITSVSIPNNVESIGSYAFNGCTALATLTIGTGVNTIENYAFQSCTGLTDITLNATLTSVPSSSYSAFKSCSCTNACTLTIGIGVTSIPNNTFSGLSNVGTIYFNATNCADFASSIMPQIAKGCTLIIGDNVTKVPAFLFASKSDLQHIIIGSSVTTIGSRAFYAYGSTLTDIISKPTTPPTLASDTYYSGAKTYPVYVHSGSTSAYQAATGWSSFTNYKDLIEYTTPITFYNGETLNTGIIILTGSGSITIQNGSKIYCDNILGSTPENLTIEDGGRLIVYGSGIQATVKKGIEHAPNWGTGTSYNPDGWYFIASPVDGAAFPTGSVTTQDIYQLDWGNNQWLNLQNDAHSSLLDAGFQRGTGYLYASKENKTLSVAGEIQPLSGSDDATVTLATTGWNLIGNPLTCKVTVDKAFSELNNASSVTNQDAGTAINPFQGIAVYGTAGDVVTFTKAASQNAVAPSNNNSLQMTLSQTVTTRGSVSSKVVDNAIVKFNGNTSLPKFSMLEGKAKLYIPQGNEQFAIVSAEAHGEKPVNFKANEDGQYTITINAEDLKIGYLHLIDNLTGNDVNLLVNPSYSFNARNDDYESRFRLVFSANMVNADLNDDFAFFSNGQLVIANEGEAVLQVIDVTGRVVATESVNGTCSKAINAKAGVYVLRLINGTDVKTQKIIVK